MKVHEGQDRLPHVDGLRAVAVLAVVIFHAWQLAGGQGSGLAARAFMAGAHGVDLFFVLSGFCLAYPFLRRFRLQESADFPVAAFAAKRLTRIVPPYWLALFVVVALGYAHIFQAPPPVADILKQLVFLDGGVHFVARPFWSLPIEFRWYFVFPFALIAYLRAPRFLLAGAVGSYILYSLSRMQGSPDFGTLPAFLAGIWVADLYVTRSRIQRFAVPALLFYAPIAFTMETGNGNGFYAVEPAGVATIVAFVVAAGSLGPLRRALGHPVLRTIGAGSYGIYLIHDPILWRLESFEQVAPWLAVPITLALSLGFSWICERPFVEGPVREACLRRLKPRIAALVEKLGVPGTLTLAGPPADVIPERVAAPPAERELAHEGPAIRPDALPSLT
jgi:peptidoglycan/LPS O-acetylase OafA/YrhL